MRKLVACFVVLCAVAGFALADEKEAALTFTTIDFPGSTLTQAFGINPEGDIVGGYRAGGFHGFLLHEGGFTTIDVPDSLAQMARGINPKGDIAGFYVPIAPQVTCPLDFKHSGFLLHEGAFTKIDFPDAKVTFAFGINPRGDIVGLYSDANCVHHGFLRHKGAFTTIDPPGSESTIAFGINSRGDIVGLYVASGVTDGFLLHKVPSPRSISRALPILKPWGSTPKGTSSAFT